MTTFKQELENLLTNYYVNSHSVTTMHELSLDQKLAKQDEVDSEATQAIIELVDRGIISSDDKIKLVKRDAYRYIKASDMPKHYRNALRAEQRQKLGLDK